VVSLAEELYLLADDPATGRPLIDVTHLDLGLGGALLLDLALRRRIALADEQVVLTQEGPTGEPLLDRALAAVAKPGRRHGRDHWVRQLGRGAHRSVQDRLVDIGILQRDDHRLLHVISVRRTHETDGRLHHELVGHLRDAVVLGRPASSETSALAVLALAVGLDQHLFPLSERQAVRTRLREIATECADGAWLGAAVAGAIAAVDAALGIVPGSVTFL
jgi:Golgi phosphoprotein 3 (GPP34)